MVQNLWALKTVHEEDITSLMDSYKDSLTEYYNYDSNVANSKQIKAGDYAVLIDKEQILGFATIEYINENTGNKVIRKCPTCSSTTIDIRKHKLPKYRCNRGHEFKAPIEEVKIVVKYSAIFSSFTSTDHQNRNLMRLRPYYTNGYNQNMSMQKLDIEVLSLLDFSLDSSLPYSSIKPEENYNQKEIHKYIIRDNDEREIIQRAIKLRRGQQNFRRELLQKYNNTCVITGCKIIDILEAAHINPYRGDHDHHTSNGLLLRADIHTLFDLNLLFINPENFKIVIAEKLIGTEYEHYNGKKINIDQKNISLEALNARWRTLEE
ncbi:HNH endonuclease [Elizabethkingia meningoseptica]|uniref:HNH endonuclease n=1 Tax=Elizabethkingia meningoseptica TaxID=238 RepID=UPI000B35D95E|nr:HNH endonuclease signature motif containing protein [Elizabethkingia meningoseptica]